MNRAIWTIATVTAITCATAVHAGITSGLIAHYKLDGNALDSSGYSRHGTLVNTPYFTSGIVGQSVHLQGRYHVGTAGDHVILPYINFSAYSAFSIALWVKWDGDAGGAHGEGFFSAGCHGPGASGLVGIGAYGLNPNYDISFAIGNKGGSTPWLGSYWSQWKHLALVYQSGNIRGYIDGILMVNSNVGTVVEQGITNVGMGIHWWSSSSSASTRFIGNMDDVRVYNRALSSSDVNQLFALGKQLSSVSVSGQSPITESGTASYTCTAQFTDGSSADVSTQSACSWSIVGSKPSGTQFAGNTLLAGSVSASTPITIKATYSSGGETRSATKTVTIQPQMEVSLNAGGVFNSGTQLWDVPLWVVVSGPATAPLLYAWDLDGDGIKDDSTDEAPVLQLPPDTTRFIGVVVSDAVHNAASSWKFIITGKKPASGEVVTVQPPVSLVEPAFLNATGGPFTFVSDRVTNGLLVITHGIWSAATNAWLTNMAAAVATELASLAKPIPNIVLFDWQKGADPGGQGKQVSDVFKIRPMGIAQGQVVADWIRKHVALGNINTNKPIQIIGHSAGGFVAGSCASLLGKTVRQITMLDTIAPYEGIKEKYFQAGGLVESYLTEIGSVPGSWEVAYPNQNFTWNVYFTAIEPDSPPLSYYYPFGGHNWAHDWYTERTILGDRQNGFYYSPFMGNGFHGYSPASLLALKGPQPLDAGTTIIPITGFNTFGSVVNAAEVYTITESDNAGLVKTIALPIGIQTVHFKYQFTTPGDGDFLAVHWGTNDASFIGLDLPISRSNAVDGIASLSDFAGQTNTLMFKLVSRSNVNAVVVIDAIGLEISDDPDNDGLTNDQEASLGTDPQKADSDGDGISDGDEVNTYHSNALNPDSDGDGIRDGAEVHSGTSPTNELDRLAITDIGAISTTGPTIKWQSVTGKSYRINRWTNLVEDSYTTVTNAVSATSPTNTFTDSTATNGPMFYWIELDE